MKKRNVIVIGGGAAGIVAAIFAAREGADVTVIEKKDRIGKKILSTGNGRCNLTNTYMKTECFRGDETSIVSKVLEVFGATETIRFFESLGVLLKDRNGYIYPISDQASTILDVLRMELERLKVKVALEHTVEKILISKNGYTIVTNQNRFHADAVILATGGKASPVLGSDGSGYNLAKAFGHRISPVVPALVQLKGIGSYFKQLAGIRTQAKVTLLVDGIPCASDTGELQLTNYGISGIPVFQISRYASKAIYEKKSVVADIDFMPEMSKVELEQYITKRMEQHAHKDMESFLVGMFHKKLIGVLLKEAGISLHTFAKDVPEQKIQRLCRVIQRFSIVIEDTNSFEQAQICAGGVRTTEIDPMTMESVYAKDLYLCGELLDVDGICGGYNLQWAWATGFIAGRSAAKGNKL